MNGTTVATFNSWPFYACVSEYSLVYEVQCPCSLVGAALVLPLYFV